ncbi:hypothetical protein LCGC14_1060860 [marine sediment metagenome]|uniref:Uncharacterized protein n=1 Tax=marine sediment metagenome TaxID=412755 RepID=A0A0F9ML72_9ZZZZ
MIDQREEQIKIAMQAIRERKDGQYKLIYNPLTKTIDPELNPKFNILTEVIKENNRKELILKEIDDRIGLSNNSIEHLRIGIYNLIYQSYVQRSDHEALQEDFRKLAKSFDELLDTSKMGLDIKKFLNIDQYIHKSVLDDVAKKINKQIDILREGGERDLRSIKGFIKDIINKHKWPTL